MKKGFTLLELLIVIGILAVLAATTVLVLNPAELLKQARDSQRVSDLATLNSALGMYITDQSSPNLGSDTYCYVHNTSVTDAGCGGAGTDRHGTKTASSTTSRAIDGTGWVPVNFGSISGGSPLSSLPVDPTNNTTYFYSYSVSSTALTYELDAAFESKKYLDDLDLDAKDGGNIASIYEVGTEPGLDI